jgi:hypothetical protein
MTGPPVTTVDNDFTRRLSCRNGDLLLWMRPGNGGIWAGKNLQWDMPDCWFLRDGTNTLITNCSIDLPEWIELHPTETAGTLAFQTMRRLQDGWSPGEPIDAPNIWRILGVIGWHSPASGRFEEAVCQHGVNYARASLEPSVPDPSAWTEAHSWNRQL